MLNEGCVYKTYTNGILPGGPVEGTVEHNAPCFWSDRVAGEAFGNWRETDHALST